jgi:hypothetical protein
MAIPRNHATETLLLFISAYIIRGEAAVNYSCLFPVSGSNREG